MTTHTMTEAKNDICAIIRESEKDEVVITRQPYQKRPKHYAYYLSNKGKDLGKVMRSMVAWANKHIPDTYDMQSSKGMLSK